MIARKDFTLGQRGGDWFALANTYSAREAIKSRAIPLSFGADLEAAKRAVEARLFTWEIEP